MPLGPTWSMRYSIRACVVFRSCRGGVLPGALVPVFKASLAFTVGGTLVGPVDGADGGTAWATGGVVGTLGGRAGAVGGTAWVTGGTGGADGKLGAALLLTVCCVTGFMPGGR